MEFVEIYDTTLRDGAQGVGSSLTLDDKIKIAFALDDFGVDFIEGGWPGSNPKDEEFFSIMKNEKLKSKLTAFGSTRRSDKKSEKDEQVLKLLEAQTEYITIYGKTWDIHVKNVIKTTLDENLKMIEDTIKFLKKEGRKVIFDAEHFFDGYQKNKNYALKCVSIAVQSGADYIVLCDTNGGSLPWIIESGVEEVKKIAKNVGIHVHNDMGLGVANSISAVRKGAIQIQGTINGIGERCGNADLTSIIPILKLKMGKKISPDISKLKHISDLIWETLNISPPKNQPFVGESAFTHKGGAHIDAVIKYESSYEHIDPSLVGNKRKIVISDLSGKSAMIKRLEEMGIKVEKDIAIKILNKVKELEKEGYDFEPADASLYLLALSEIGNKKEIFKIKSFSVEVIGNTQEIKNKAKIEIEVDGKVEIEEGEGNGPVNAIDNALRKALQKFFPEIEKITLKDFKVRVVSGSEGTSAKVRVLVESSNGKERWTTIGVSENIIKASLICLKEAIEYELIRKMKNKKI